MNATEIIIKLRVIFGASGKAIAASGTLIVEAIAMKKGSTAQGMLDSEGLKSTGKDYRFASRSNSSVEKKRKKDSSLQFENIIEKIHEGFIALDGQMNYLHINQRGGELLRRTPEDLIGKNY